MSGDLEEQPDGLVVRVDMAAVAKRLRDVPDTWVSRVLGRTKDTYVTFTPFCGPAE